MQINIKATGTTLTEAMHSVIEEKLKAIETFIDSADTVFVEASEVTHHSSGPGSRVEIRIQPTGHYSEGFAANFYEALDVAIPKIREQLTHDKDKKISLRRHEGAKLKEALLNETLSVVDVE